MPKNSRDEFSPAVKKKLSERVALRCSNPNCRVPTSAPSDESSESVNSIGVAAHICAAAGGKGARRYIPEPEMTSEQRKSIENGIWLCANCSILIDKDEKTYSADLLKEWKRQAEKTAKSEQGAKLPTKQDAIDNLTMALTGQPTKRFLVDAIANTHKASAKSLETIDPRFTIETAYDGKKTTFSYIPKEKKEYSFTMTVGEKYSLEFKKGFLNLLEHGEDLKINLEAIKLEGLPLPEDFNSKHLIGEWTISPYKKRKVTLKLFTKNLETNQIEQFDDIYAEMRFGTKSFTVKGVACKGIFKIELNQKINLENYSETLAPDSSSVTLEVLFEEWNNLDINRLPYFNKLLLLFSHLVDGYELNINLEFEGEKAASFHALMNQDEYIKSLYSLLKYTELCRTISKFINKNILFSHKINCTAEEYNHLYEIVDIIQGNKIYKEDELDLISLTWTVPENFENNPLLKAVKNLDRMQIRQIESFGEKIKLFSTAINLPLRELIASPVIPKIDDDISTLKEGYTVTVNLMPQEKFSLKINYNRN